MYVSLGINWKNLTADLTHERIFFAPQKPGTWRTDLGIESVCIQLKTDSDHTSTSELNELEDSMQRIDI